MTLRSLVRKLLRDVRAAAGRRLPCCCWRFQACGPRSRSASSANLAPFFGAAGRPRRPCCRTSQNVIFEGPGQIIRTLIGGERIDARTRAMDMLSIGYVHPLMQTIFCIWAIGRAAGAIAGEIDRGTMELLLAQPLRRRGVILAHLRRPDRHPAAVPEPVGRHWPGLLAGGAIHVQHVAAELAPASAAEPRCSPHPGAFGRALLAGGGADVRGQRRNDVAVGARPIPRPRARRRGLPLPGAVPRQPARPDVAGAGCGR